VAAKDDAVFEPEEQALADSFDAEQPAAVEALDQALDRCARMRRLDFDLLADEHLQPPRRPR
jgi:hypothetical protein